MGTLLIQIQRLPKENHFRNWRPFNHSDQITLDKEQVDLVRKSSKSLQKISFAIYNIFCSCETYLKWLLREVSGGDDLSADFLSGRPEALKKVLDVIAEDIASLQSSCHRRAGADARSTSACKVSRSTVSDISSRHLPSGITVLEAF